MENELTFVAPEGVYSVTEEHRPANINTHLINTVIYPTHLSTVHVHFSAAKSTGAPGLAQLLGGGKDKDKDKDKEKEGRKDLLQPREKERDDGHSVSSSERLGTDDDGASNSHDNLASPLLQPQSPPTTDSPKLFSSASIGMGKKKLTTRPKHNIRTTTSTFVTRLQSMENLNRVLQNKHGDVYFLFYNHTKNFYWTELGNKTKEPLARITFSASPTCHDVNKHTAKQTNLDLIIGFSTGDLVWFEPISGRYVRLNKQGCISGSPCTAVRWIPGSASMFIVAHTNGTIIVYDTEREDAAFTPEVPYKRSHPQPPLNTSTGTEPPPPVSQSGSSSSSIPSEDASSGTREEWNPLESIFVSHNSTLNHNHHAKGNKPDRERVHKNPVSHWRVSKRSILDMAYSSDARYLAVVAEDGCLRTIDAAQESLVDCFASYFGSFTCVAFSRDGKFVLTGGQDDLVTIFSMAEGRAIARCQGHSSFVSSVAFDPVRTDKRSYRFGSVGEDNKLILWDFSAGVLHRPKMQTAQQQRVSMSSTLSLALRRRDAVEGSTLHLPPPAASGEEVSKYHPAPSRNEVSVVQPVLMKHIEGELLTAVAFTPSALLTAAKSGYTKLWVRPLALRPRSTRHRPPQNNNPLD